MQAWVHSGSMIDFVIVVSLLEGVVLLLLHRLTGRGVPAADLLPNLGAGLCLMLALRCAIAGAGWVWIAVALAGAGLAHSLDLRRRWHRG